MDALPARTTRSAATGTSSPMSIADSDVERVGEPAREVDVLEVRGLGGRAGGAAPAGRRPWRPSRSERWPTSLRESVIRRSGTTQDLRGPGPRTPPRVVIQSCAPQLGEQVHEAGAADPLGRHVADRWISNRAVHEADRLDRAVRARASRSGRRRPRTRGRPGWTRRGRRSRPRRRSRCWCRCRRAGTSRPARSPRPRPGPRRRPRRRGSR